MARKLQPNERDIFAIVNSLNEVADGRSNNVGKVTLNVSAATTSVNFMACSSASCVVLSPLTADAAAAIPTTYISSVFNGGFVITHANNAQADRTFTFAAIGG